LEAQLGQLRQELEASQKAIAGAAATSGLSRPPAGTDQELQAAHTRGRKVKQLTEALAQESKGRDAPKSGRRN